MRAPTQPGVRRANIWAIALTVTLATFMEVLDTSIANVALPHIAGSLGASQDEATWVLTSYLVSNAVILPASAYLTTFIGRKKFYMICVVLFGVSSMLCGLAPSLPILILLPRAAGCGRRGDWRLRSRPSWPIPFTPKQRGQAFALYGLAVVCAPAIGPSLGGWITDNYDWRWIFFHQRADCVDLSVPDQSPGRRPAAHYARGEGGEEVWAEAGLLRLRAARDRVRFARICAGQRAGRRLVRVARHRVLLWALRGFAHHAHRLGAVSTPDQEAADSESDSVLSKNLRHPVHPDVRARLFALWHDGADSAVRAGRCLAIRQSSRASSSPPAVSASC